MTSNIGTHRLEINLKNKQIIQLYKRKVNIPQQHSAIHQTVAFYHKSISFRYAVLGRLSATLVKRVANVTRADALTPIAPSKLDGCSKFI